MLSALMHDLQQMARPENSAGIGVLAGSFFLRDGTASGRRVCTASEAANSQGLRSSHRAGDSTLQEKLWQDVVSGGPPYTTLKGGAGWRKRVPGEESAPTAPPSRPPQAAWRIGMRKSLPWRGMARDVGSGSGPP